VFADRTPQKTFRRLYISPLAQKEIYCPALGSGANWWKPIVKG
jgi:hypothetical protein